MSHPVHRLLIALILSLAASQFTPADADVWKASIDAQTRERYIPVELWAGAEWDGNHELKMPKVDATYRHRNATYYIKGALEWKHPATDEVVKVYERTNPGRDGVKLQIFAINQEQNGLGRLFDGRPHRDTRTSSGGLKFPLGRWRERETRALHYRVWDSSKETGRTETITINKIDFVYQDSPYCLEFDWRVTERIRSQTVTHDRQTYTYCPGKSMANQIQH